MAYDIAPKFGRLIRKLPELYLRDMRMNLSGMNNLSAGTQAMIVAVDAELLRRKWSRDLG